MLKCEVFRPQDGMTAQRNDGRKFVVGDEVDGGDEAGGGCVDGRGGPGGSSTAREAASANRCARPRRARRVVTCHLPASSR